MNGKPCVYIIRPSIQARHSYCRMKNIHFKSSLILSLFLWLLMAACSSTDTSKRLVLAVGVDPEQPYLSKQVKFLKEVLETLDYELEVQQFQSALCLELSNSGQVDGEIWRIKGLDTEYQNLTRVPVAIWSHPELAFVKKDIELDGWQSLAPYRVAFRVGTKVVENNIQGIVKNQVPLGTIDEGFELLAKGEVDVVISDNIVGSVLLESEKYKRSGIAQIVKPLDTALLFTYLHKKHSDFVPLFAKAIRTAKQNGTYAKIIGEPPVYE